MEANGADPRMTGAEQKWPKKGMEEVCKISRCRGQNGIGLTEGIGKTDICCNVPRTRTLTRPSRRLLRSHVGAFLIGQQGVRPSHNEW